ncbi:MAG: YlxR family protein [Actinobacteria bacterium]|nr:YlxR family protein [Actinomycetota bacterium]
MDAQVPSDEHVPQRTCVGCRRQRPRTELLRVARTPHGARVDDERLEGRGAYICPDPDCVAAARRRGGAALARALRVRTDEVASALDELTRRVGRGTKEREA